MAFEGTLQDFTVNMHGPELEHTCIEVQQGDTASRQIRIHLKDFGGSDFQIPYGATAVFCINKSDGHKVYDACEIEDESTVIVALSNQAIACAGRQKAQIYLSKDGWDIKTQTFTVNVPRAVYTDDAIKSSDEFGILSELIAEYEAIVDSAGQSAVSAADSAAAAEAARQGIEESLGQISENKDNIAELKNDLNNTNTMLYNSVGYYEKKIIKKSGDYVVNLPKGTYIISGKAYSIPNGINTTVVLFNDYPYNSTNPDNIKIWDNKYTAFSEETVELPKTYKYMHVWGQDNFSQPVEITIKKDGEVYHGKTEKITDMSYIKYDIYENGETGEILHNDLVSTRKIYEKALYIIAFPESLKCMYNAKDYTGERKNFEIDTPFSVYNDDFIRFRFKKRNGENIEPNDPILSNVIVYKVIGKSTCYDVTVSASDTDKEKKEKSDIVLDGENDTKILAALIGCHESISVYLYGGTYNISEMWTTYANTKIALSVNMSNNFDGGIGYRRYINVIGETPCSPQALKSTVFKVTKDLHTNMDSLGHYFILGASYPKTNDEITRLATSIIAKNINIIGYKYDKPITYIDTTRCLSTMLDSVNVRGWAENIEKYNQFASLPNMDCCGIRVGRGSNYGIQNHVKNSNVWYCGKGISCNGEHFLFEDVKTHHCYIGWYFGDKKTVGTFEHTNIMIGCTIEGCYRMMILSKQGITEEKPYEDGVGYKHSPLRIIGLSTETWWGGTADNASPPQATLPILEILKGCYTGAVEIESDILKVFEDGSGENMSYTRYSGSKTYTRSSKNTITE